MDTKTFYETIGSDGDKVLARFMGKEAMVVRFLKKFLDDRNFEEGKQAIEEKDYKKLETAAHTLKGICGNLGLERLYGLSADVVAEVRAGKGEEAEKKYGELEEEYKKITALISQM